MRLIRYFAITVTLLKATITTISAENRILPTKNGHSRRAFNYHSRTKREEHDDEEAKALALNSEANDFDSAAASITAAENAIDAGMQAQDARESMHNSNRRESSSEEGEIEQQDMKNTNQWEQSVDNTLKEIQSILEERKRSPDGKSPQPPPRTSSSKALHKREEPTVTFDVIIAEHDGSDKEVFGQNSTVIDAYTPQDVSATPAQATATEPTTTNSKSLSGTESEPNDDGRKSYFKSRISEELDKLMSESSSLADELRSIFDSMETREILLFAELDKLKSTMGIALKKLNTSAKARFRRDGEDPKTPYKACVSIESDDAEQNTGVVAEPSPLDTEPLVREYIGPETKKEDLLEYKPAEETLWSSSINETIVEKSYITQSSVVMLNPTPTVNSEEASAIDLNSVYWMKLPQSMSDGSVHKRVEKVFGEVSGEGKDVLIIPVSRHFNSGTDVSEEFFKAVASTTPGLRFLRRRRLRSLRRQFKLKLKEV